MRISARSLVRTPVALAALTAVLGATNASARPPTAEAASCEGVWQFISEPGAGLGYPSAEISIERGTGYYGLSSLSPLTRDGHDSFAFDAPVFERSGSASRVELRMGRRREVGVEGGPAYDVWVTECDPEGVCQPRPVHAVPTACEHNAAGATLVARDPGGTQQYVIRFRR